MNLNRTDHMKVLEYWKTVESLTFFDVEKAIKDDKKTYNSNVVFRSDGGENFTQQLDSGYRAKFFLGLLDVKSILTKSGFDLSELDRHGSNPQRELAKETCLGQITLVSEEGYSRFKDFEISTFLFGFHKFLIRQRLTAIGIDEYVEGVKRQVERLCEEVLSHKRIADLRWIDLDGITASCLISGESCFLAEADLKPSVAIILPQSKGCIFLNLLTQEYRTLKEIDRNTILRPYHDWLDARSSYDIAKMEIFKSEIVEIVCTKFRDVEKKNLASSVSDILKKVFSLADAKILNSFFIPSLSKAFSLVENGEPGGSLLSLLTANKSPLNLFSKRSKAEVIDALYPRKLPPARWPSNFDHSLSTMQQLAVSSALDVKTRVFSVNGPPGTGKTTLLKDIIANVYFLRSVELSKLTNPFDAFEPTTEKENGLYCCPLIDNLKGFEMIIGCSGNGAAENISLELPSRKTGNVDQILLDEISYLEEFNTDSQLNPIADTWGVFSAALGNRKNNKKYIDRMVNKIDEKDKKSPSRFDVFLQTDKSQFRSFSEVSSDFKKCHSEVTELLKNLDIQYIRAVALARLPEEISELESEYEKIVGKLDVRRNQLVLNLKLKASKEEKLRILGDFGLFDKITMFLGREESVQKKKIIDKERLEIVHLLSDNERIDTQISEIEKECEANRKIVEEKRFALNDPALQNLKFIDPIVDWLNADINSSDFQMKIPYSSRKLNELRSNLFVLSLELHQSWVHAVKT